MKNEDLWEPTKFEFRKGHWRASRNRKYLAPASRLTSTMSIRAYEKAIRTHARGHLADMGCGRAPLYGVYKGHVEQITCIDWSASMHDQTFIDVPADLNCALPIPSDSFDTILSTSVLEHIWNHAVLWQEFARVLRPGGKLILATPFLYPLHEEPYDYFRWTPFALQRAAEMQGLGVVELQPYGGGIDVCTDILLKMVQKGSRRLAAFGASAMIALLAKGPLRALSDKTAAKMPLGYMLIAQKGTASNIAG